MISLLNNPAVLILLVVAGLCFGFLVGFLLRGFLRRDHKKEEIETKTPEPKPANRNLDEVAHLWRDKRDGRLVFQIGNEYYKRDSDLTPKEKKILLKVVMDFYQWLEPTNSVKPAEPVPDSTPDQMPVQSVLVTNNVSLGTYTEDKSQPKRTGLNPVRVLTQALDADVAVSAIPAQSMVAQIDEILQKKLIAANMQKWAIRLIEFPNRGMVVMVGLEQYDGIDAVPYERVRKMIREAVAEWEKQAERK